MIVTTMDFKNKLDNLLETTGTNAASLADKMDCTAGYIRKHIGLR